MLLPETCSIKVDGVGCNLPPAHVVSIQSRDGSGEYMVAVVCDDHKDGLEKRLQEMQKAGRVPEGRIHFQPVKLVVTDCVAGMEEDYVDIELKRGANSDRKLA
ncbi:hypothetical protein [Nitrososphaera sp.]|uniref:hypothetical protein n=1 Tax=Nitrososphaera sp. TaxID=1971748 RepID=UPI00307E50CC